MHARLGSMVASARERVGHCEGVSGTLDRRCTSPNFTAWLTATLTAAGSSDEPAAAFVIVESSASASSPLSHAPLTVRRTDCRSIDSRIVRPNALYQDSSH